MVQDTTPKVVDPESTILGKRKRGVKAKKKSDDEKKRWKKTSILQELPYLKLIVVCHSIDLMHIKNNVCRSLLRTLMNDQWKTKDHARARADL